MATENLSLESSLRDAKERLKVDVNVFPLPGIITAILIMLLLNFVSTSTNHHLGLQADIISLSSPQQKSGLIWLAIFPKEDKLIISTDDKIKFELPLVSATLEDLTPLVKYLEKRNLEITTDMTLSQKFNANHTKVTLAVDQALNYYHFRPILLALAKAKITRYAFETIILKENS